MTFQEQKRMVEELRRVQARMNPEERRQFDMMAKRSRDDEDFEVETKTVLQSLHAKYFPKRSKEELERAWNTAAGKKQS